MEQQQQQQQQQRDVVVVVAVVEDAANSPTSSKNRFVLEALVDQLDAAKAETTKWVDSYRSSLEQISFSQTLRASDSFLVLLSAIVPFV